MPAAKPSEHEVLLEGIRGQMARIHTALPGVVVSYDAASQTATVKPAFKFAYKDPSGDGSVKRYEPNAISNVPVAFPGAGDFSITWDLAAGDEVLLIFAERSLDEWRSLGGSSHEPSDLRRFDLSDAIAYPDTRSPANAMGADAYAAGALVVGAPEVRLGSSAAAEFVALRNLVETELNRIWTTLATHTHPVPGVIPGGGSTTSSPALPAILDTANNTGATKVKAE